MFYSGGEQVEPDSEDPPPRCSKICRQALSHKRWLDQKMLFTIYALITLLLILRHEIWSAPLRAGNQCQPPQNLPLWWWPCQVVGIETSKRSSNLQSPGLRPTNTATRAPKLGMCSPTSPTTASTRTPPPTWATRTAHKLRWNSLLNRE